MGVSQIKWNGTEKITNTRTKLENAITPGATIVIDESMSSWPASYRLVLMQ